MPDTRIPKDSLTTETGLVDLGRLVSLAAKNTPLITAFLLGGAALGFLIVSLATLQFRASAQLMLDPRENLVTGDRAVLSNVEITEQIVATEVAVLRSNILIGDVVDRLRLDQLEEFSSPDNVLTLRSQVMRSIKRLFGGTTSTNAPTKAQIVATVQKNFAIQQVGISNALSVEFQSRDPEIAAAAANALVTVYIDRRYNESTAATSTATAWLTDRTEELKVEINDLEQEETRRRTEALAATEGGRDPVSAELSLMSQELAGVRAQIVEKETLLDQLAELEVSVGLLAVSRLIDSVSLDQLREQQSQRSLELAQADRAASSTTVKQRAQSELGEINQQIEIEAAKYLDTLSRQIAILRARSNALDNYSAQLMSRLLEIEQKSIEIRQAEQESVAARSVYQALLIRLNETRSQQAFGNAGAQQIVRAEVPSGHATPRRALTIASTSFLGAALALIVVAMRELLFNRFRSLQDLERFAGKPVLAGLPPIRSVRLFRGRDYWTVGKDTSFAEQLRRVRSRLQFDSNFNSASALMITSSVKGEGKTEILVALAKLMVRSGRSVLVIDCDFLNPRLSMQTVGLKHLGICDVLEKNLSPDDAIVKFEEMGFDIMTVGTRENVNADLLATQQVGPLLEKLTQKYDMVLVDTPPVQVSSDAQTIGVHVDQTIVVYDYSSTDSEVLGATLHELERSCVDLNGILANRVPKNDQYSIEYY